MLLCLVMAVSAQGQTYVPHDLCSGETLMLNKKPITQSGNYPDTLKTLTGEDSIVVHVVNFHPVYHYLDTVELGYNQVPYEWRGQTVDAPGTYRDEHTTVNGCDSVYELYVRVLNSYIIITDTSLCEKEIPLLWRGKLYYEAGTYTDAVQSQDKTDSIFTLRLRILPEYRHTQHFVLCEGGSISNGGRVYTESGTWIDTLSSQLGCDSIVTTIVATKRSFHHYDTVTISNQEHIDWHGQTITQGGNYFDYHTSAVTGCDSVYQLTVYVYPVYIFATDTAICQTDAPYIWRGKTCDQPGAHTYEERYTTIHGYDSIYRLNLTIHPAYQFDYSIRLCPGQTQTYRGKVYSEAGEYTDTLHSEYGCDSICHIHVSVLENFLSEEHVALNDGQSFFWPYSGLTYSTPGTYEVTEKTRDGCDSIMRLFITRNPSYYIPEVITICEKDETPYVTWHGLPLSESGTYWDSLQTVAGQDSVFRLDLTVLPRPFTYQHKDICESESFTWNGQEITASGIYYDTLPSQYGCDSIIQLSIRFQRHEVVQYDTLCDGDTMRWEGLEVTEEAVYNVRYPREGGCDSILSLHVTMFYPFTHSYSDTICETSLQNGEPYLWGPNQRPLWGKWNNETRHYEDSTYWDCAHKNYFHLHVVPERPVVSIPITLCAGDSVEYIMHDGSSRWFSTAGKYYDTIPPLNRPVARLCDSVVCYQVQVYATSHDTITRHVADTQLPYLWKKYSIAETGYYADTVERQLSGCDSITVLHLMVDTTYLLIDSVEICTPHYNGPSDSGNTPYIWEGHRQAGRERYEIYYPGIYWDSLRTVHTNVDSVYKLVVTVLPTYHQQLSQWLCEGDSIYFGGQWVHQGGTYRDTLHTVLYGCDSIVELTVNMLPSYVVSTTQTIADKELPYHWQLSDMNGTREHVFTRGGTYFDTLQAASGCDSVVSLQLTVGPTYLYDENVTICQSETPYQWHGRQYWTTGIYFDTLQTVLHFDSVHSLHLTVFDTTYTYYDASICRGESFDYHGKHYTRGGLYTDTIKTKWGCDSIVILRVRELADYLFSDTVAVANRAPYEWRGKTFTHTGVYYDSLQSVVTGCDSVYQLVLTVYDKELLRDTTIRICSADLPFNWRGRWLNGSQLFYDTITIGDVDTVWRVDLRVIQMDYETIERTFCYGESFSFNGKTYRHDTLVHDTVFAGFGCGKEYTLLLRFRQPLVIDQDAKTPAGTAYLWSVADTAYALSYDGDYTHIIPTADGACDSIIYRLHLKVGSVYYFRDSIRLCQSEVPYRWHMRSIEEAGWYYDSLQTELGFDSVYILHVQEIMPVYYAEQHINICAGAGAFYYRGKPYNTNGVFYDTIPSVDGCDSIFKIIVRIHPTFEQFDTVHISDKETYEFDGRILSRPGRYDAYFKAQGSGCDSIVHLELKVHPSYLFNLQEEICAKDTLVWHNRRLTETGIYYDSLLTQQGYDSVYVLQLTVHPSYFIQETVEVCPNRTTYLHGLDISKPGVYMDTLYTNHGCDSIYHITVNWKRSFRQEYSDTICQGEAYTFFGVNYTKSGTYKYEIGCDSIVIVHLHVRPKEYVDKHVLVAADNLPYRYNGHEYYQTGLYSDTSSNRFGCDSIFNLHVVVTERVSQWIQTPLCPGSEIKVDSVLITRAGLYTFIRRSQVTGQMDSIFRMEVYDAPAYDLPAVQQAICHGDTFLFCGKPHTRAGHYDYALKTAEGCDSLLHLDLTVYPTYHFYKDAAITDYQSYLWEGSEYTQPGEYSVTYPSQNSCDSTWTLRLTVVETTREHTIDTICQGQKYVWRGNTYTEDGYYTDTVCILATLTSAIYSLQLTTLQPTLITGAEVKEICADAESFEIAIRYSGATPTEYSLYFDPLAKQEGFKDIHDAPFLDDTLASIPLPKHTELCYQEHTCYVRPDYYSMRLVLDNGVCGFSRSDSLTLLVKYPSWILEQHWDDVVAPLKPELNGGYDFVLTEWYVNGVLQPNTGIAYLHNDALRPGDEVVMRVTRQGESYAIPTCPLVIEPMQPNVNEHPIMVYPTQAPRRMPMVTVQAPGDGAYEVYGTSGMRFSRGRLQAGETSVMLPAANGIYFILVHQGEEMTSHKVMVY